MEIGTLVAQCCFNSGYGGTDGISKQASVDELTDSRIDL